MGLGLGGLGGCCCEPQEECSDCCDYDTWTVYVPPGTFAALSGCTTAQCDDEMNDVAFVLDNRSGACSWNTTLDVGCTTMFISLSMQGCQWDVTIQNFSGGGLARWQTFATEPLSCCEERSVPFVSDNIALRCKTTVGNAVTLSCS